MKRFACGFVKATLAVTVGLIPASMLYLIAQPRLAQATGATWLEALLWVTALAGVCIALGIVDSVDNRKEAHKWTNI